MLREKLQQQKNNLAHAYVVFGETETNKREIDIFLQDDLGINLTHNPDVFFFSSKQFGISESREISSMVSKTNIQEQYKYIIIETEALTVEAQNALLKTIEEPDSPTRFFILLPTGGYVLDTVISRVQIITTEANGAYQKEVELFLQSTYDTRTEIISDFFTIDENKKEKPNKGKLSGFLNALETEVAQHIQNIPDGSVVYHDMVEVSQYLLDRSANTKHILEYIALRLPVLK